jgi:aspartyl-tRNA(Asn)/glutamyl-tRNA(Gln) amidotransferase subunit C
MKVTDKDVAYVAGLANLELTSDERTRMVRDLNNILDYIDRLNELDTSEVPPMAHTSAPLNRDKPNTDAARAMREDNTRLSLPHEAAMQNAPQTDGTYFEVPKVIDR